MIPDIEGSASQLEGVVLKKDIRQAIPWGTPDSESIGYTQQEFVKLLIRALKRIERLEGQ